MSEVVILFIILIFILVYLLKQLHEVKRRLIRLMQENAVIWQFIKERESR